MRSSWLPLLTGLFGVVTAQVTVSVSTTVPAGASKTVDPSFVAWAFEERSFYYFAGAGGSPVALSNNIFNAVASRTGTLPFIRVGGSSLNAATFDSTQSQALVIPEQNQNRAIPVGLTIGPSFFESFNNINANYQLDIPMDKNTDMANSVQFSQAAWKTIGADHISVLELGNEPNSYGSSYAPSDYSSQFETFSTAISKALGISTSDRRWQVGSLTNGVGPGWNASIMFNNGLQAQINKISAFSAHYYQFSAFKGALNVQNNLMSHDAIVNKMQRWQGTVDYLAGLDPSIPLNFAEVASGTNQLAVGTNVGERSFGAALWQIDFMLYAMSMGINRVNMQSGLGFQFSQWEPIQFNDDEAAVYANTYASLFVADFISTSGAMQCAEIDLNSDVLTAYAAYENGNIARVALVNFNFYNGSESSGGGDRDSTTFSVQVPSGHTSVIVMRLSSALGAGAMDASDITWGGESWTLASDGNAVAASNNDTSTVTVKNGYASVEVPASEAVMVLFSGSSSSTSSTTSSSSGTATATGTSTSGATSSATGTSTVTSATTAATQTGSAPSVLRIPNLLLLGGAVAALFL